MLCCNNAFRLTLDIFVKPKEFHISGLRYDSIKTSLSNGYGAPAGTGQKVKKAKKYTPTAWQGQQGYAKY